MPPPPGVYAAPPPPQAAPVPAAGVAPPRHLTPTGLRAASNGTVFEIFEYEMYRIARIVIQGTSVTLEAGMLHYWLGDIQMQVQGPSLGGMAKSLLTSRPLKYPIRSQNCGCNFLIPCMPCWATGLFSAAC